ncbi:ATP-binding cassette sub-family C member Sur [Topomyia yanbarensis]|uniref:ATP-binding cassette sub-family C member Sur n=1 Tax=Topomyia yanbarensis TaxID=2498891 RepID=UPI00273AA210|nr:ATP-binding cassette sub-family C member Sur [Topomyia yanbarensis]XP_058815987.1 ATP-binding cassette sub-family C member Sur [Topomyia yanbarensis]XP_058815988.1 ATP-binding cassette sub-family C member Sur [Topomyia yanbarensis]XP_058815989.1 ATP-binding cassette sub-family C member Sur [Topomyia yanbarensis]
MICDIAVASSARSFTNPPSSHPMRRYIALMGGNLTPEQVVDVCYLNMFSLIVNTLALAGLVGALLYVGWKFDWKRHNLLALHNLRSTFVLASILTGICEVAQYSLLVHGLATLGHSRKVNLPVTTKEQLALTEQDQFTEHDQDGGVAVATAVLGLCSVCIGLMAVLVAAAFVRIVELKDRCGLLYIVLVAQGALAVAKWCKFEYINGVTDTTAATLPSCLAMGSALTLAALTLVDGITIYLENSSNRRHISTIMSKKPTGYKSTASPFLSRITFWWITPLLWRGFAEPLELENLGELPERDTSRYHYDQFLFIYQSFKNSVSLWRCYVLNCWQMFLAGGVFKLLGDLCALVGPLCISNIVDYIAKPVTSSSSSSVVVLAGKDTGSGVVPSVDISPTPFNHRNQSLPISDGFDGAAQLDALTWEALLANGWFVAVLVLVSSLAQGTFSQASTHIMDMEGIKLKNALQGLVYRKTLLLRSSGAQKRTQQQGGSFGAKISTTNDFVATGEKTRDNGIIGDDTSSHRDPTGCTPTKVKLNDIGKGTGHRTNTPAEFKTSSREPLRNSEEEIKHEIAIAIDSDDRQQFAPGTTAGVNYRCCPTSNSPTAAAEAVVVVEKQAKTIATDVDDGESASASEAIGNGNRVGSGSEHEGGHTSATASDAGTITNLMSDDAFNVMSFVRIAHYVWAIPLKIGLVMYLLYQLLGISTVIGSIVCIVTMTPMQFIIGKMMSANSKKASECTDERLRRINEVLLGIKLIKLNAWENVFREKITNARRRELRHLDLDSCYWTLMVLLTHISSVLITFVTVAVFTHLEEQNEPGSKSVQFTAARLFASLALFNQLTVPLFIFPITIPIILSAVVSTSRLEAFFGRPEVSGGEWSATTLVADDTRNGSDSDVSVDDQCEDNEAGDIAREGVAPEVDGVLRAVVEKHLEIGAQRELSPRASVNSTDNLCHESSERESENELDMLPQETKTGDPYPASSTGISSSSPLLAKVAVNHDRMAQKRRSVGSSKEHREIHPRVRSTPDCDRQPTGGGRLTKHRLEPKSHEPVTANKSRFGAASSDDGDDAVYVRDARFQWGWINNAGEVDTSKAVLKIDYLRIPNGKLTIIVGRSGSGKSSLLAALLKEINHLSGEVKWNKYSTLAYVPQHPWLLNATVRDNILFGEPYRPKRFERVLKVCALKPDIELMPNGDLSEIGERGIKLSGGQRQRIVMARALYSTASVVIMDDPLSSLDNEVGRFVFDQGIRRMMGQQKRTVIMITQKLQLVFSADYIIAMDDFAVCATGTLSEIENNYPQVLRQWNAIIAKEQQSRETGLSSGKTARERWKLFKIVSRISLQKRHTAEEYYEPPGTLLYTPLVPQRNSSLFGSRFHTHDLPLPIDECHGENVQLRRHYSKRYRSEGRALRGFSDGVMLAATGSRSAMESVGGNGAPRTQSLQTRRDIEGAGNRLLPVVSWNTSFLGQPNPDDTSPVSVDGANRGKCERFHFSDSCRGNMNKSGLRQFLRRLSIRTWQQAQRNSNPTDLRLGCPGENPSIISKASSVMGFTKKNHSQQHSDEQQEQQQQQQQNGQNQSLRRLHSNSTRYSEENEEDLIGDQSGDDGYNRLIVDDERKYGTIPTRIYWLYLKASGLNIASTFLLSALAQQCLRVYTDFWLQNWTERTQRHPEGVDPVDIKYNFRVYALLSGMCILLAAVSFPAGQMAGSNARRRLHRQLVGSVLKNSIHFFQTVPLGRIMNRLSIDIGVVDKKIAATSQKLLQFILLCLCAVLINSVVTPYFILLTIPICGIYYVVQKFYRCSSRELQRLESITYSPIIAHFSETIDGVTTIRAYRQESRFTDTLFQRMEANNVAQVILNSSNRWLGITLDYLGAFIVFIAIVSGLVTASLKPDTTSSSLIGLAINYALLVPIYLNWVVKLAAEMEMYLGAVERIQCFVEDSQERVRERNKVKYKPVPISWPKKGDIVFENVSLRYESQKENVITNLNLTIPTGQRIGICGRTGSGKSSLALSLFGVLELVDGRILIDDVDIASINSEELRCRLSIIPQEVILFGGSLRENLDPRGHFGDLELWNCLELAQLKEMVLTLPDGLDTQIDEGRPLFSAGQRQLLCLARAILRGSVCLVLDEATSSLDLETEKLVLEAAGRAFKVRTVVTIAHRLHSLFDYDRVIVLEQGNIVEDGCPRLLRKRSGSKFAAMLKASTDYQQHQSMVGTTRIAE